MTPNSIRVACLIPVLNRPHRVAPLVESFRKSRTPGELYFLVNDNDHEELRAIQASGAQHFVLPAKRVSWAQKLNDGFRLTGESSNEPWLFLGADDLDFVPGWLDQAEPTMNRFQVIGIDDSSPKTIEGNHSTHPLVSRQYAIERGTIDQKNLLVCEAYRHFGPDTELCETAKARGVYTFTREIRVVHLHPVAKKAAWDSTYEMAKGFKKGDLALYFKRRAMFSGFSKLPTPTPISKPIPKPSSTWLIPSKKKLKK